MQSTVCNSEFLGTTLLQAFKLQILTNDTVYRSDEFMSLLKFTCGSVTIWSHSWLKINFTESTLSSVRALWGRPLHWHLLVLPLFLNFLYNLFRPETVRPLLGNSLTSFVVIIFEFAKIFIKMLVNTVHHIYTLSYMHLPKLVLDLTQCAGNF